VAAEAEPRRLDLDRVARTRIGEPLDQLAVDEERDRLDAATADPARNACLTQPLGPFSRAMPDTIVSGRVPPAGASPVAPAVASEP